MTDQTTGAGAARDALRRLLPAHHEQISVSLDADGGADRFRVGGGRGAVAVTGSTPATVLTGVRWYLTRAAGVSAGLPGDSLARLPSVLPAPGAAVERTASVPHRFALNDTDDGYTGPYREWPQWERLIDLLALHGVNEVLVTVGTEEVYRRTFRAYGHTDADLRAWIPGQAHQPWWLLQNMSGFAGPVPAARLAGRADLGRRIAERLRALGMRPVLPGYFGTVPPGFAGPVIAQGVWPAAGFTRPGWLDPRDRLFAEVAAAFYAHQRELFGDAPMFKMDLLHEGGLDGGVPLDAAARAVMDALQAARPGAVWAMLGWLANPRAAVTGALDPAHVLILDGASDRHPGLDRAAQWGGVPYAFGTIHNFGGHTTLGANAGVWADRFAAWRDEPGGACAGIAYMPEGNGTDPAAFELFTELPWHPGRIGLDAWFAGFARGRYGAGDPHAARAWDILRRTAYAMPADGFSEPQDGPFCARPSLTAANAASWSPSAPRYDLALFEEGAGELLRAALELGDVEAYRYDLVTVVRQALANRAWPLLPRVKAAFERGDAAGFAALTGRWMTLLGALDDLLATDSRFLLGAWLAPGEDDPGVAYDLRSLITTWGGRAAADEGGLADYANRELAGLVGGFYAMRWRLFFDSLDRSLATGVEPEPIDWFAVEDAWARRHEPGRYPATPAGDPVEAARSAWAVLTG
ncbi:MAG TPA: alpha-N-acetylglucosaminidase [Streptosporangiaceae bacterium]|jgi:alpha-N-acetylglucosaminidase